MRRVGTSRNARGGGVLKLIVIACVALVTIGLVVRAITGAINFNNNNVAKNPQTQQQLDAIVATSSAMQRQQADEYARTGTVTVDPAAQEQLAQQLDDAAKTASRDDAAALRASAELTRVITAKGLAFSQAVEAITNAGGLDAATLDTKSKIEARLAMAEEVIKTNEDLDKALRTLGEDYQALLQKHGMNPSKLVVARDAFLRESKQGSLIEMRQVQRDLGAGMRDYLTILNDQHGRWILYTHGIVFEDQAASNKFQKAADAVAKAVKAESDWMQRHRGVSAPQLQDQGADGK